MAQIRHYYSKSKGCRQSGNAGPEQDQTHSNRLSPQLCIWCKGPRWLFSVSCFACVCFWDRVLSSPCCSGARRSGWPWTHRFISLSLFCCMFILRSVRSESKFRSQLSYFLSHIGGLLGSFSIEHIIDHIDWKKAEILGIVIYTEVKYPSVKFLLFGVFGFFIVNFIVCVWVFSLYLCCASCV